MKQAYRDQFRPWARDYFCHNMTRPSQQGCHRHHIMQTMESAQHKPLSGGPAQLHQLALMEATVSIVDDAIDHMMRDAK